MTPSANGRVREPSSPSTIDPIIGSTPAALHLHLLDAPRYQRDRTDEYETQHAMNPSADGVVRIMNSKTSGKTYILKHTYAQPIDDGSRVPDDGDAAFKFPNEIQILHRVWRSHPNIVAITDAEEDRAHEGRWLVWMEHCDGGDLLDQLSHWTVRRRQTVPEQFVLHVIVSLFEGLAYLHHGLRYAGNGTYTKDEGHVPIVHGDIKEHNVFIRHTRTVGGGLPQLVIGDFGCAKIASDPHAKVMPGTLEYHAPEDKKIYGDTRFSQATLPLFFQVGQRRTTARDVYAAGQIIYLIAAKERYPYPGDPNHLRISREYDTEGIRELIVKCLQVSPAERATADFGENGVLHDIHKLRRVRDAMVARHPLHDPLEWAPKKAR